MDEPIPSTIEWSSADELSSYAEVDDCIVFRKRRFGFFRRKRYARVVQIDEGSDRPLIDRVQVVEVESPRVVKSENSKIKPLSVLMNEKEGYFLNKPITNPAKNKEKGFFAKIRSFFSRLLDSIQNLFEDVRAKVEYWHEEKMSTWGHSFRRIGYHLCIFFVEAVVGITILLSICVLCFIIFWYFALAFACLYGLVTPGTPLIFPLTVIL